MSKYILILFSLIILFVSCSKNNLIQQNKGFTLSGNVENIPDSSWIYLQNNGNLYDSTMVLNGHFKLEGQVDGPTKCFLIIKSTMDYKPIWIENNKMTFIAKRNHFREAIISGSATQLVADKQYANVLPTMIKIDSLYSLLKIEKNKNKLKNIRAQIRELFDKKDKLEIEAIGQFPQALPSVFTLNIMKTTWGKKLTDSLFSLLSKENQITKEGKSIQRYLDLNKNLQIGDHYIDFAQTNVNGNIIKLSDIKAKVILLDFWSSTCGPCRYENKNLVKIYKEFNPKGFEIFGVSGDTDKTRWLKAIREDELVWENVRDDKGNNCDAFLIYGINGVPDNFLISSDGKIIARDLRGKHLRDRLLDIL